MNVYKSYAKPAILFGSEVWWLRETEIGIMGMTDISMLRVMCGVLPKDRNGAKDC